MVYALRRTVSISDTGNEYVDNLIIECTAAELRAEIA